MVKKSASFYGSNNFIIILACALGIILISGLMLDSGKFGQNSSSTPKNCTDEAMICPDGSAVGRTGPNCEFAPCPQGKKTDKITSPPLTQEYRVGGSFTEKATEAEMSSLGKKLGSDASSISLLESFPLQFQIISPSKTSCEKVRKALSASKFIDSFGDCQKAESGASDDPNRSIRSQ